MNRNMRMDECNKCFKIQIWLESVFFVVVVVFVSCTNTQWKLSSVIVYDTVADMIFWCQRDVNNNSYQFYSARLIDFRVVKIGCCFSITENVNGFTKRESLKMWNIDRTVIELWVWSMIQCRRFDHYQYHLYERMQRKLFYDMLDIEQWWIKIQNCTWFVRFQTLRSQVQFTQ